jgi:hypothetical protein
MYFPVFRDNKDRLLSDELTYTIEALACQVLAAADVSALNTALQKHNIVNMLVDELRFLGYVPQSELPKVQAYLDKQEPALSEFACHLVREPDNDKIRQELCSPLELTDKR